MSNYTIPTETELKSIIGIGLLVGGIPGYENYTMFELATSLVDIAEGIPPKIDLSSAVSVLLNPAGPMAKYSALVDSMGGIAGITIMLKRLLPELDHGMGIHADMRPIILLLTALGAIMVMLRFYSRHLFLRNGMDDWAILIAVILSIITSVLVFSAYYFQGGHHVWDITYNELISNLKIAYTCEILYYPDALAIKASLLLFYHELTPQRPMKLAIKILLAIITLFTIGNVFAIIFQCTPIAFWNDLIGAKCIDRSTLYLVGGVGSIITDVVILLLPMPMVWNLQLAVRSRIGVTILFGLGGFVCITSIMRLLTLTKFGEGFDITYAEGQTGIWSIVELNLGVICACVPALRGLLVKKMPNSILSKIKRSQASSTSDSEGAQAHSIDKKTGHVVNVNRLSRIDDDEEAARRHRLSTRIGSGFDIPLTTFQHLP